MHRALTFKLLLPRAEVPVALRVHRDSLPPASSEYWGSSDRTPLKAHFLLPVNNSSAEVRLRVGAAVVRDIHKP